MKMQPLDVLGVLYSSPRPGVTGLRFGWKTNDFFAWTQDMEEFRAGIREEIVAEAHHLALWIHRFPEIAFLIGTLWTRSLLIGLLCFIGANLLEIFRFYGVGASWFISQLSRLWGLVKPVFFLGAAILLWPSEKLLSTALLTFLVLQGGLSLITSVVSLVFLPITIRVANFFYGENPYQTDTAIHVTQTMSLVWVLDRWRKILGLAPRT